MPIIDIRDSINVTATIGAAGAGVDEFGRTLFVTKETDIEPGVIGIYNGIDAVEAAHPAGTEVRKAATVYFGQTWYPKPLLVGRWTETAVNSKLTGGAAGTLSAVQALESVPFRITGGTTGNLTAVKAVTSLTVDNTTLTLSLGSAADFAAVAAAVQTAIRAKGGRYANVSVAHTNSVFVLTYPQSETTAPIKGTGTGATTFGLGTTSTINSRTDYSLTIDGATYSSIDFSSQGSLSDVAAAIQAGLRATTTPKFDNCTVSYQPNGDRFVVEIPTGSINAVASGNAAGVLGLDDGVVSPRVEAETLAEALSRLRGINAGWHWLVPEYPISNVADNSVAIGTWANTRRHIAAFPFTGAAALAANETTSAAARVAALDSGRTLGVWTEEENYAVMGLASRFAAINYSQAAALPDAKWLQFQGITSDKNLTDTQREELERKRINYYADYQRGAILQQGVMTLAGRWIDTQTWVDWLVTEVENELWDLATQAARVPRTDAGIGVAVDVVISVMERGVLNGGIGPGLTLSQAQIADVRQKTANDTFDGVLTNGYLVEPGAIADLSNADKAARKSPPINVWLTGSSAIHFFTVNITVSE